MCTLFFCLGIKIRKGEKTNPTCSCVFWLRSSLKSCSFSPCFPRSASRILVCFPVCWSFLKRPRTEQLFSIKLSYLFGKREKKSETNWVFVDSTRMELLYHDHFLSRYPTMLMHHHCATKDADLVKRFFFSSSTFCKLCYLSVNFPQWRAHSIVSGCVSVPS